MANVLRRRYGPIGGPGGPTVLGAVVRDSFFEYVQNFTFSAGGADNFVVTIPIQADAHFLCVLTMYDSSLIVPGTGALTANAPAPQGGAIVQLTDTSAQRQLQSAQVPINALFGTATRPFVWPFTHAFRANGGIGINITGAGATNANAVMRLVFAGFKVPIGQVPELDNPAAFVAAG